MQVNLIRNTLQSNQDGRPIVRPLRVEFLAVAGGGGGTVNRTSPGDAAQYGNGGGAGGVITGSFCAEKFTDYPIAIGGGGAPYNGLDIFPSASNGEDTTLFGVTAIGGGGGAEPGKDGGSGGGGVSSGGDGLQPTATYSGFGNNGSFSNVTGGAGGGAGSAASGLNGGNGITLDFTGTSVTYAGGGAAGYFEGSGTSGTGAIGKGGNGGFQDAGGSEAPKAAESGSNGIAVIKYFGAPKATGGTITQSNGITYHTFTSGSVVNFVVTENEDNFALNNCNDGTSV